MPNEKELKCEVNISASMFKRAFIQASHNLQLAGVSINVSHFDKSPGETLGNRLICSLIDGSSVFTHAKHSSLTHLPCLCGPKFPCFQFGQAETLPPLLCKILNYACAHGSQSGLRMGEKNGCLTEGEGRVGVVTRLGAVGYAGETKTDPEMILSAHPSVSDLQA